MVDKRGRNVLHIAVENGKKEMIDFILKKLSHNQKHFDPERQLWQHSTSYSSNQRSNKQEKTHCSGHDI